jgi:DNA repair protein RecO (recombination protein O)
MPYGETHAIVTLLTPSGMVAAMARGAKKPQSRFAAGVQMCVQGLFTISQRSGMGTVQQLEIIQSRRGLRERLDLAAYAAYFCELVQSVAQDRPHGSEAVYNLFAGALDRLQIGQEPPSVIARIWEAKVLQWVGVNPTWSRCTRCHETITGPALYIPREGGMVCEHCSLADVDTLRSAKAVQAAIPHVLESFSRVPWERIGSLRLSDQNVKLMGSILQTQLQEYAGISPKSRAFLESIADVMD